MKPEPYTRELEELMQRERVIEAGLGTFIEVGSALAEIRDDRLYRAKGFERFDDYCRTRWGFSRSYAYRLIDSSALAEVVSPNGDDALSSEAQARALAPLRDDPDAARAAWQSAVDDAHGHQPTAAQVQQAVQRQREPVAVHKRDIGDGLHHPAPFSDPLMPWFRRLLPVDRYPRVLDPFAGTGRIHELPNDTVGIEIEAEYAALHERTIHGDARDVLRRFSQCRPIVDFDAICTSPTYGNRLADHHNASDPQSRRSYTHDLGRELTDGNSGVMQWHPLSIERPDDDDYRALHRSVWRLCYDVLTPHGRFVLNIKDHTRDGYAQPVSMWHVATLVDVGFLFITAHAIDTRHYQQGDNRDARHTEWIIVLERNA